MMHDRIWRVGINNNLTKNLYHSSIRLNLTRNRHKSHMKYKKIDIFSLYAWDVYQISYQSKYFQKGLIHNICIWCLCIWLLNLIKEFLFSKPQHEVPNKCRIRKLSSHSLHVNGKTYYTTHTYGYEMHFAIVLRILG